MQRMMAEKAKSLLQNGTVNRVLGWKTGEFAYDIHLQYLLRQKRLMQNLYMMIFVQTIFPNI